jgi:hypothetical protein
MARIEPDPKGNQLKQSYRRPAAPLRERAGKLYRTARPALLIGVVPQIYRPMVMHLFRSHRRLPI